MIRPGKLAALLLLLLASAAAPAAAQESCRIPETLQAPPCERREAPRGRSGDFDFYVLAFSWSPAFCGTEAGSRSPGQCRDNRFGWVVHGLWPQYGGGRDERQPWPQYCGVAADARPPTPLPSSLLRRHFCAMPDARLMQCQWVKHGSCSGLAPEAYFAAIQRLAARFAPPLPEPESQSAAAFRQAVLAAYPDLQARHLQVIRRDGRIRELRLCLDKALAAPVDCRK